MIICYLLFSGLCLSEGQFLCVVALEVKLFGIGGWVIRLCLAMLFVACIICIEIDSVSNFYR